MHPNLHPQVLLIVTKLVFHRLENGYPRRWHLFLKLLIGTKRLLDHIANKILLRLLYTTNTLRVVRWFQWNFGSTGRNRWAHIILDPSLHLIIDALILMLALGPTNATTDILGGAGWCLVSLSLQLIPIRIRRQRISGMHGNRNSGCCPTMHSHSFGIIVTNNLTTWLRRLKCSLLLVLLSVVHFWLKKFLL